MKAARSLNHRGLPELELELIQPQMAQKPIMRACPVGTGCGYARGGPRSFMGRMGLVYVRGRCTVSNIFSLNCEFVPRSCACAQAHTPVLYVLRSLLSRLGNARHSSAAGQVQGGTPPKLLWSRRTVRSPHGAVWKVKGELHWPAE